MKKSFPAFIDQLASGHLRRWRESDQSFPRLRRTYSASEQRSHEADLERFFELVEKTPRTSEYGRNRIARSLREVASRSLGLGEAHTNLLFGDFQRVGEDLAAEAKRRDPAISDEDVYQAARNAWTGVAFQALLGGGMVLTPAIFAYSMLYPYTDNYLDDPEVSDKEKKQFNKRLAKRLQGGRPAPNGEREGRIFSLLGMIEEQYNRALFPEVHASLLAIQKAQTASTGLRFGNARSRTAGISVEKGGTSVLADGYLASGRLSLAEADFAFGWGVALQLGDDLQDVTSDAANGIRTVFTEAVSRGKPLDELTNRLFHYTGSALDRLCVFGNPALEPLKDLVRMSALLLIVFAAGAIRERFTGGYIARLERHTPLRFEFLRRHRHRFAAHDGLLGGVCGGFCRPRAESRFRDPGVPQTDIEAPAVALSR